MITSGFITIERSIQQWRWYNDPNTFRLWFHLLLNANYEDRDFEKITVHRGELVTSYASLSRDLCMTVKAVRIALGHLKATGEVASRKYPKFQVITIQNYDLYQMKGQGEGQAKGRQGAGKGQAKGNNGIHKQINTENNKKIFFSPPSPEEVLSYALSEGLTDFDEEEARRLVDLNTAKGWAGIKDWHPLVRLWRCSPKEKTQSPDDDTDEFGRPIQRGEERW